MKHINGKFDYGIYRITTNRLNLNRSRLILVTESPNITDTGYAYIVTTLVKKNKNIITVSKEDFQKFHHNDIVELGDDGIYFLWEYDNNDNCFFLTEACSCNCLMCPQPPRNHNKILQEKAVNILSLIPKSYKKDICITGGEPTLFQDFYLEFMKNVRKKFPKNFLITLTNGKSFSDLDFLNKFYRLNLNSTVAISFCADVDTIHDSIVRAEGSFNLTQQGIYNLAKAREAIELRIVVSKINYKRLPWIADFIYRNFPFVVHVAFMGLEYTGYAHDNFDKVSINPKDYENELTEAVLKLNRYGIFVSIYNIPLCLLNKKIRKFSEKSISKWKNTYQHECLACSVKDKCCGAFTTSSLHPYTNIKKLDQS